MSSWTQHVMWWQVYPLGATGAPIRPAEAYQDRQVEHRLPALEGWLDHLVSLGLNGLLLGPVFASETHGYDTVDHFRIDPRLGDEQDLQQLIEAAHRRGIRVLLDGVFNHVGRSHPLFAAVEQSGDAAASADMFRLHLEHWTPGNPVPADVFEGHDSLVELDHDSAAVVDLVVDIMCHWLQRGIDGWRLDAAYAVPPSFWARVLPRVRERFEDAWFLGEVIQGDQQRIVAESGLDSSTQYELWQGIWHSITDRNFFELTHAITRHDEMLATFVPQTFVGNHDVTRIATAVGRDLVPHAIAVLFTVAGIPSVYAGDELGTEGLKEQRLGGDDAVRPQLAAAPPNDAELTAEELRILDAHRALIAVRRDRPWLHTARTDVLEVRNEAVALRTAVDDQAVITVLNLSTEKVRLPAADAREVLAGRATLDGGQATLDPAGWAVLGS